MLGLSQPSHKVWGLPTRITQEFTEPLYQTAAPIPLTDELQNFGASFRTDANRITRTATILNALKRRAQAVLNDTSIDSQSRAIIRYAMEINDPWLAELVRRADAGEPLFDTIDFSQTPNTSDHDLNYEKVGALAEMICRVGDDPETKSAALLVLVATVENSAHPKALANTAKHFAFTRCGELNLYGIVDAQVATVEGELLANVV